MSDLWCQVKLSEISTIVGGKYLPKEAYVPTGRYWIYGSNSVMGHYDRALVNEPHVVMAAVGANAGAVRYSADPAWINNNAFAVVPQPDLEAGFLYLWLQGALDLNQVLAGTGQPYVKRPALLAQRIEVPPLSEQRCIVNLIGALDAQIKALDTEKNEVLMLRATLMSDHVADCGTRSSLGTVVDVAQGKALPKGRQGVTSGPVPWFKIADMTGAGNHFGYNRADTSMTPEEIAALRGQILPIGSVVFPRVGAAVLTEKKRLLEVEGAVDENHLVLLPRPDTDSEYLLALMEWVQLSELVQSGAVPSLNMTLIRNLDVPVADPETQRALGHVLGRLRVLGRALDEEIGAARSLRSITLANVLSHEFEIPESYDALLAEAV